jgi:hypothetical protein
MAHAPGSVLKPLVKIGRTPADCWSWLGKIDELGCAIKQFNGKPISARRWMWTQLFGPVPDGLVVTTECGSKQCTNPHCLRLCTQADACRASGSTTLVAGDIAEIRKAKTGGGDQMANILAERYGVSHATIRDIWRRKSWASAKPFYGPATPKHSNKFAKPSPQSAAGTTG